MDCFQRPPDTLNIMHPVPMPLEKHQRYEAKLVERVGNH